MTDLASIAKAAGGEMRGRQALIPGPGHSRHDRSLSLKVGEGGKIVWHSFAGDDPRAVWSYLRDLGAPDAKVEDRPQDSEAELRRAAHKRSIAQTLWDRSHALWGTVAEAYLWQVRGVSHGVNELGDVRFLPSVHHQPYGQEGPTFPAMIGAIRQGPGDLTGVHLTFLAPDGTGKADVSPSRKMIGQAKGGGVILRRPLGPVIVVGEGIESTATASERLGLPGIASLSADGMRNLTIPEGVQAVIVACDLDPHRVGQKAAADLITRLRKDGIDATLAPPPPSCRDWNEREITP
jgi:putative DNA primase/helicase